MSHSHRAHWQNPRGCGSAVDGGQQSQTRASLASGAGLRKLRVSLAGAEDMGLMPRLLSRAFGLARLDPAALAVLLAATMLHIAVVALVATFPAERQAAHGHDHAADEAVAGLVALSGALSSSNDRHETLSDADRRRLDAVAVGFATHGAQQQLRVWSDDGDLVYRSPADRGRVAAPSRDRVTSRRPWSVEQDAADGVPAALVTYLPGPGGRGVWATVQPLAPVRSAEAAERRAVYTYFGVFGALLWLAALPVSLRLAKMVADRWDPRRRRLLKRVARGLAAGEFELHYQPKVDLSTGEIDGVEALVRWRRQGELMAPAEFLPAVEQSPLIRQLTLFVLDAALRQAGEWKREGPAIPVAVNLAAANLADPRLPDDVADALRRHDIRPSELTLEVTETAVIDDDAAAGRTLRQLAELEVQVSIDDFGTGHSSLARLSRHPFGELKIDRSFVMELTGQERPIVATIIRLAKTLNLRVVAEGVEDQATLNALRTLGCDVAQGYLLSRPVPASEIPQVIARLHGMARTAGAVHALLDDVRESLALDAAFVAEFVADEQVFHFTRGDEFFAPPEGGAQALEDSYCARVVSGVFPNLMRDAKNEPGPRELPVTEQHGIGAYIGVPLHRPDGSLYGTLCGLADRARPDLTDQQVATLADFGERIAPLLDHANLASST
jgi:EAL domain-containing protein (putative c-di-GMP-specific phosphodiesterase class I)